MYCVNEGATTCNLIVIVQVLVLSIYFHKSIVIVSLFLLLSSPSLESSVSKWKLCLGRTISKLLNTSPHGRTTQGWWWRWWSLHYAAIPLQKWKLRIQARSPPQHPFSCIIIISDKIFGWIFWFTFTFNIYLLIRLQTISDLILGRALDVWEQ